MSSDSSGESRELVDTPDRTEYELDYDNHEESIAQWKNGPGTVGAVDVADMPNDATMLDLGPFNPGYLLQWAEAIQTAFGHYKYVPEYPSGTVRLRVYQSGKYTKIGAYDPDFPDRDIVVAGMVHRNGDERLTDLGGSDE
jgi:hypothetical protein